jgi:hypothetical protein
MSYSNLYFDKELTAITFQDVVDYFVESKDESDKIEYKSYHSTEDRNHTEKENGIIRTICGLLNSEGGLVIWGAPVGQTVQGRKEKIFIGELSPVTVLIEKDAFIRRVTDLITPSPAGIRFHPIENNGSYIYIIEVNQSSYSPHQFRNTYYMRIDGQTRPAPHHFIEALFKKVTFPRLEGYIKIESFERDGRQERFILRIQTLIFNKSKLQNEYNLYSRLIVNCGVFANFQMNNDLGKIYDLDGHELRQPNAKNIVYYNEPITNSESIIVTPQDLRRINNEGEIILIFGGKYSPLKVSKYKLTLTHFGRTQNEYLTSIDENKFFFEASDELGDDEDRMRKILGR